MLPGVRCIKAPQKIWLVKKGKAPASAGTFLVKQFRRLALAELEVLTSLLAAELLTFNGTRVTSHESFLLEGGLDFGVVSNQGAGNAKTDSAHLASDSTATSGDFHVPFFRIAEDGEGKVSNHVLHFGMEVILEITTIDSALAGTRLQDHSGDSILATASATVDLFILCGSDRFILRSKD